MISKTWLKSLMNDEQFPEKTDETAPVEEAEASEEASAEAGLEAANEADAGDTDAVEAAESPEAAGDAPEAESKDDEEDGVVQHDDDDGHEEVTAGEEDPLAPAYDLEDGELIEDDDHSGALPWSSRVEDTRDFFQSEILYRFDLLEDNERDKLTGTYRIQLSGKDAKTWSLDLGRELTISNEESADADIVLEMGDKDFMRLINGELNPQLAVLAQRVKVTGDLKKALTFQSLLVPVKD